ncbi:MAG: tRNA (adenosine(37)-N6)-threonylcarbamoyltransferase complex ATPase subunit type 1 TsaE [Spirochaetia bacterium]|nr:tRNA (adenosine(37)-N6)-threonylcarbamoyltransferase complex ATPase subunit type 1 TsaE [Spirochaetia bacterium]
MIYDITSINDLKKAVKELLLNIPPSAIFALQGHPGAGKTTLTKEAAILLEIEERVQSPTFNIMNSYSGRYFDDSALNVFHLDCYRLTNADSLIDLHFSEISPDIPFYAFIEWPEKVNLNLLTSGVTIYSLKLDTVWSNQENKVVQRTLTYTL